MSYAHAFHAGGCADVVKHLILTHVCRSNSALKTLFIDTHAGKGLYDLFSGPAQRTREHSGGISRLFLPQTFVVGRSEEPKTAQPLQYFSRDHKERERIATAAAKEASLILPVRPASTALERLTAPYVGLVEQTNRLFKSAMAVQPNRDEVTVNPDTLLRWYPGSPAIAALTLSKASTLYLMETRKEEHAALSLNLTQLRRAALVSSLPPLPATQLLQQDGFSVAHSLLADDSITKEYAATAIHIDPTYENPKEAKTAAEFFARASHLRNTTSILWYPRDAKAIILKVLQKKANIADTMLLSVAPKPPHASFGLCLSGVPPGLVADIQLGLADLGTALNITMHMVTLARAFDGSSS